MDKEDVQYKYIQWNIFSLRNYDNFPLMVTQMDLEGIMLSEISQIKKNTV